MNKGKDNIEGLVSDTILQKPYSIQIGQETYEVAPPSIATLILASELISQLPKVELDKSLVTFESLRIAKDCKVLGDIVATLILGAENITTEATVVQKSLFGLVRTRKKVTIDNRAVLSDKILKQISPSKVNALTLKIINRMEIGDFSGLPLPDRDKPSQTDKSRGSGSEGNDSIWAVVAGMAKAYNLTFDYILYKMSFANVRLYNAVLPSFSAKKDGKKDTGIILNGDDPNNQDAVNNAIFDVNEDE